MVDKEQRLPQSALTSSTPPVRVILHPDHRFCGLMSRGSEELPVHIVWFNEMENWCSSPAYQVHTLCGVEFRPTWMAVMVFEEEFVCPVCLKLQ